MNVPKIPQHEPPEAWLGAEVRADVPKIERHDTGNAAAFARLHGRRLHYVPVWKEWLIWSGAHWERDTAAVHVAEAAKDVGRSFLKSAGDIVDSVERSKTLAWANSSLSVSRIKAMIDLARGIGDIPLDHEDLDADGWLLGVRNGVVDLRSGQFRDADPAHLMSKQCPVEWSAAAEAPRWDAALEEWFPNPDTRAYVHRLVGQALVGQQRDHVFVIHFGGGGNGKGTFVRALQHVLGPYAATPELALLTETKWGPHATATATLFRARLAVASETEKRVRLAEASIKNLTGGDRISARKLYENPWSFDPTHSLHLLTNHLPEILGRDAGIWRRIRVVPWTASFSGEREDQNLDDIFRSEAAGILRWAVTGVAEWQEHGLAEPDEVRAATTEYRSAEDIFGRFAGDTGLAFAKGLTIPKARLAEILDEWTAGEGIRSHRTDLAGWLENEHGCRADREWYDSADGRKQRRIWVGCGIPPTTLDEEVI